MGASSISTKKGIAPDGRIPGPLQEIGTGGVARRQEKRTVRPVQPQRFYTRDARRGEAGEGGPYRGREKDPKERQQWIVTTAVSSTAIEGVHFSKEKIENLLDDTPPACKPRKKKPSETRSPE